MNLPFVKYQSLGNDFILIKHADLLVRYGPSFVESDAFKQQIILWCNRHFGIGADGVLVVTDKPENLSVTIFNADGSQGQFSGNGIRSAAHYFQQRFDITTPFEVMMGGKNMSCFLDINNIVVTKLSPGTYQGPHSAALVDQIFKGDLCDVGNPHFLIEMPKDLLIGNIATDFKVIQKKLMQVGYDLVIHQGMDNQVNVEFFWEVSPSYYILIPFERGAGMTLACSSGAAALAWTLYTKKRLLQNQELEIMMEGGVVKITIDADQKICLSARAQQVFKGVY